MGDPTERGVIAAVQDAVQEYWETSQMTAKLVSPDSHKGTLCRVTCCTAAAWAGWENTSPAKAMQLLYQRFTPSSASSAFGVCLRVREK